VPGGVEGRRPAGSYVVQLARGAPGNDELSESLSARLGEGFHMAKDGLELRGSASATSNIRRRACSRRPSRRRAAPAQSNPPLSLAAYHARLSDPACPRAGQWWRPAACHNARQRCVTSGLFVGSQGHLSPLLAGHISPEVAKFATLGASYMAVSRSHKTDFRGMSVPGILKRPVLASAGR